MSFQHMVIYDISMACHVIQCTYKLECSVSSIDSYYKCVVRQCSMGSGPDFFVGKPVSSVLKKFLLVFIKFGVVK
jgi:ribonucleotide reductase alpha subunit